MPLFAEADRFDYALDQYRSCWGWLLEGGRTPLGEVFDRIWSGVPPVVGLSYLK